MKIKSSKVICELKPSANNPRNSEGAFIRLNNGNILFAYSKFSGESWQDEAPASIASITLDANGDKVISKTPKILVSPNEIEGCSNVMCASLIHLKDGKIALFYDAKKEDVPDKDNRSSYYLDYIMRISDDGEKFDVSTEKVCTPSFKGYYVLNNDRIIRLKTGRLIVPAALHRVVKKDGKISYDGRGVIYFFISDDDGKSWKEARDCVYMPTISKCSSGLQEPGILELDNGSLYMYARTDRGRQYESFSVDGGETWSVAQPSWFTAPCSPMKIKKNPFSGKYYAVWNPVPYNELNNRTPNNWGRTPLAMAESADGINYGDITLIESDEEHGYCYPALFFLDENTLLVSYCSGGKEENGAVLSKTTIRKIELDN